MAGRALALLIGAPILLFVLSASFASHIIRPSAIIQGGLLWPPSAASLLPTAVLEEDFDVEDEYGPQPNVTISASLSVEEGGKARTQGGDELDVEDEKEDDDSNTGPLPRGVTFRSTLSEVERKRDGRENDVLSQLLNVLDKRKEHYPVIIGGIGDSGTRGVRALLRAFGVQMLRYDAFVNRDGDSRIYEDRFAVYDAHTNTWSERIAHDLYKYGIHRARTVLYNETHFQRRAWEFGRQFIGAMLWRTLNVSKALRKAQGMQLDFWGMKHPRTCLTLPFFASALGKRIKYVHVLRDPKEVATGNNQQMFEDECRRYYGRKWCSNNYATRLEFWTDVNWDVYKVAKKYLDDDSYMMIRIEDLVQGNLDCVRRLAQFVGLPEPRIQRLITKALNMTIPYKTSYFGNHLSAARKTDVLRAFKAAPARVKTFAKMVGYSTDRFEMTKSCSKMPSIDD